MQFVIKRVGAGALAAIVFATAYSVSGSGAIAQDQAEPQALETVRSATADNVDPAASSVRFVATEVVQPLPLEPADEAAPASNATSLRELVDSIDTGAQMSREVTCLAQAVYFEARGEPLDGQLAVARVIVNRAQSSQFPDDYCAVVTQRGQFSFVRGGRIPSPPQGAPAWADARAIARIAHRDLWDSAAADALYFHATRVNPGWAGRMTARATISRHIFYR